MQQKKVQKAKLYDFNGVKAEVSLFFFLLCFLFPFPAQAVLFLCATSNLNLLCKDGYIF